MRKRARRGADPARRRGGAEPRGLLPAGGAAARLVERLAALVAAARASGAVAVVDIGHERTDVVRRARRQGGVQPHASRAAAASVTEAIARSWQLAFAEAERAKHTDGFIASNAEPAHSRGVGADPRGAGRRARAAGARSAPDAHRLPRPHRRHASARSCWSAAAPAARARELRRRAARHAGLHPRPRGLRRARRRPGPARPAASTPPR